MKFVSLPAATFTARGLVLVLCFWSALSFGQSKPLPDNVRRANLEAQVTAMEQAFMQADFETFADFMHPDVVRLAGGPDVLAQQLRKGMEEMTTQGGKVNKVTHGTPSRIVSVDRQLQCTVPQTTEFQLAKDTRTAQSTLLAVSTDDGQHWAFLDTAGKDWETVRRLVPSLSREIVLPQQK
ncbi:hypothetical protein [Hymenobacter sp. CRA2]|uniref:hypothetical protein n=1 Tax=Hymenobacter sp. CRA2 TaxID=1955620 RepID=UPI00098F2F9E|nr:hypothetical protein [Hymenobacter sp. CRA2]OON69238.1 hypothetical protein B0919_08025 [Hymenobacter sp. CRA2]